jgi:hypothetical protein
MNEGFLELLDTDYLLSTFSHKRASGFARIVEGLLTFNQIKRFFSSEKSTSKDIWTLVKPTVREIEKDDAVLIFEVMIQIKPYTDKTK